LVFLPLTFLPYPTAFAVWSLVNLGMLLAIAVALRRSLSSLQKLSVWELFLLCLAFFPVFATFHQGQDAILLLLLLVMSFRALNRKADFLAGCWLGLGMFKYHLILPLALVVAVWKGRKFLLAFLGMSCTLAVISLAILGWNVSEYPIYAMQVVSNPGMGGVPFRQLPNLMGLLAGWPVLERSGWPIKAVVLVASAVLLIAVAGLRARLKTISNSGLFVACGVISAVLVGFSTNTYDLSLLILSLALVADYYVRLPAGERRDKLGLILPVVPLLISPLWFYLWMRWERINLIAFFLVWWLIALRSEILDSGEAGRTSQASC
jgi:hypothetical protein